MTNPQFRKWLIGVLIVAAVMRISFLAFSSVLPVVWDQRLYAAGAIGLISYVDESGAWHPKDELSDRNRFRHYYEKYLDGEGIDYLSYAPHTLTEARNDIYLSGPLYPAILATIIYVSPWEDFTVARVFGIILDLLSLLFLLQVGRRLVGTTAAIVAGFVYAVYFPFIFTSATLLLETSTTCLALAVIYFLLRAVEDDSTGRMIIAGTLTGLLILNKPTAMLLGIPFAVALWVYARRRWTGGLILKRLTIAAVPAGLLFVGWLVIASAHFGQVTLRDPEYADANLRHATSIFNEGYGLDAVDDDFWTRNIWSDLASDPAGAAGLFIKKLTRLWEQPYNDFDRSFVIPRSGINVMHAVLVFLGIAGFVIWFFKDFGIGLWLAILPLYYTGIHLIFHSVSRYVFTALPLIFLAGAWLLVLVVQQLRSADRQRKQLLIAIVLLLLGGLLHTDWLTVPSGMGLTPIVVYLTLLLRVVLLVAGVYFLLRGRISDSSTGWAYIAAPVVILLLYAPSMAVESLARDNWGEWSARLSANSVRAGTRLYIENPPEISEGDRLVAIVDMMAGRSREHSFTAFLPDGNQEELILGEPPLSKYFYVKPVYKAYGWLQNKEIEQIRQYAFIFLDTDATLAKIREQGFVDIAIALNDGPEDPENWLNLYGSAAYRSNSGWVPAIRRTSVERYVERGDPRIRIPVEFLSDSAISYYIGRTKKNIPRSSDLSPSPGIQNGRYNIFLVHFSADGRWQVY